MIAGISNYGDVYYTINHGATNANTFLLFIIKLCEHMYTVDRQWRSTTIIMLDNAKYHKGKTITKDFEYMKVPVMYLGPYHFRMAPIEVYFSFIKSHDLNPSGSSLQSM